jgi:hypothetical protein
MRCPACGADNTEEAKRCAACGERTGRKPRSRAADDDDDGPFARGAEGRATPALRAYLWAVWGLIPLVGLVLGPVVIVLALRAWRLNRRDPQPREGNYALISLLLGVVILLCNAAGVALIVVGLTGAP